MVIEKTVKKDEARYSGKRPGKDLYYVRWKGREGLGYLFIFMGMLFVCMWVTSSENMLSVLSVWLMTLVLCVYLHLCNMYSAWVLAGLAKRNSSSHSYQSETGDTSWVLGCTRFGSSRWRKRNPLCPRIQLLLSIVYSQVMYILLAGSQCTLKDVQIKMIL